jgi:hypothetical protein
VSSVATGSVYLICAMAPNNAYSLITPAARMALSSSTTSFITERITKPSQPCHPHTRVATTLYCMSSRLRVSAAVAGLADSVRLRGAGQTSSCDVCGVTQNSPDVTTLHLYLIAGISLPCCGLDRTPQRARPRLSSSNCSERQQSFAIRPGWRRPFFSGLRPRGFYVVYRRRPERKSAPAWSSRSNNNPGGRRVNPLEKRCWRNEESFA